jgi:hypothetical protein
MGWSYPEAMAWVESHGGQVVRTTMPWGLRIVVRVKATACAVTLESKLATEPEIETAIAHLTNFLCERLYPTR